MTVWLWDVSIYWQQKQGRWDRGFRKNRMRCGLSPAPVPSMEFIQGAASPSIVAPWSLAAKTTLLYFVKVTLCSLFYNLPRTSYCSRMFSNTDLLFQIDARLFVLCSCAGSKAMVLSEGFRCRRGWEGGKSGILFLAQERHTIRLVVSNILEYCIKRCFFEKPTGWWEQNFMIMNLTFGGWEKYRNGWLE